MATTRKMKIAIDLRIVAHQGIDPAVFLLFLAEHISNSLVA
jgi:hypothetical protein